MSYGCHNRKPLKTRAVVQDGYFQDGVTRTPRMIPIPDPMTKSCQYTATSPSDARCAGCIHQSQKKD